MNNYKFDSIVNRQEADALKELIFKRARERAEAMTNESQSSYASNIRNDVMDLARESFVSNKNPFSVKSEEHSVEDTSDKTIGFSQRHLTEIKTQINYRNKIKDEEITQASKEDVMIDARSGFENRASFMGALNFLNSQASITLVNKKGKSFEALA